jgi:signal recognition particle subunit SRP54
VSSITEKVLGAGTIKGVRPDHYRRFNRIGTTNVHDELIQLIGGESIRSGICKKCPSSYFSGRFFYLKKLVRSSYFYSGSMQVLKCLITYRYLYRVMLQQKSCMLVAADVYRPASIDQLTILGKQVPP